MQRDDLHWIAPLLGAVSVWDGRGVAARLEALEIASMRNMEEMRRMVQSAARNVVQATAVQDFTGNPEAIS